MTRGADHLPVSDHAVLRYLQRVLGVDIDQVRRTMADDTASGRAKGARGVRVGGLVYRLHGGYVTTCFTGDPHAVRMHHAAAKKKILRKSKNVPIVLEE